MSFTARSSGGSTFSTQVPGLIEALEHNPMFGKVYRRAPECACGCNGSEKVAEAKRSRKGGDTAQRVKLVPGVTNWQEAAEYLVEKCGSASGAVQTPEGILREAAAKGVKFCFNEE